MGRLMVNEQLHDKAEVRFPDTLFCFFLIQKCFTISYHSPTGLLCRAAQLFKKDIPYLECRRQFFVLFLFTLLVLTWRA